MLIAVGRVGPCGGNLRPPCRWIHGWSITAIHHGFSSRLFTAGLFLCVWALDGVGHLWEFGLVQVAEGSGLCASVGHMAGLR